MFAKNGAFLDEHYLRPTIVAAWNAGRKNGTDIYSQYLSQFSLSTTKAPPGSMVFFRTYLTMVHNALALCRLALGEKHIDEASYTLWRKKVARTVTLRDFCVQVLINKGVVGESREASSPLIMTPTREEGRRSSTGTVVSVERSADLVGAKRRRESFTDPASAACRVRLDESLSHQLVSDSAGASRSNYCAMCSLSLYTILPDGKVKSVGKRSPRIVTFCSVCKVHLCKKRLPGSGKSYYEKWHSKKTLKLPKNRYM